MEDMLVAAVVFFASYHIIKLFSDHFLKRKLIKGGHIEQAGILQRPQPVNDEVNKYPSLKWGLVAFMAGLGFIVIEILRATTNIINYRDAVLPIGILLVFVSLGFLIYFFIMNGKESVKIK
jgi:hypothetical protein